MLTVLLELCAVLGHHLRNAVAQPLLTVLLLGMLYAGRYVAREGSLEAGLHAAFSDRDAAETARQRGVEAATVQADLRQFAASDRLIQQLLQALLQQVPSAARARLAAIHDGGDGGGDASGRMWFDIINAVGATGRSPGPMVQNQSLAEWSDFLASLLSGRCQLVRVAQLRSTDMRERVLSMGAAVMLACPVTDIRQTLVGGIFLTWDANDPVPCGDDLASVTQLAREIGAQIASALDLRNPSVRPGMAPLPR